MTSKLKALLKHIQLFQNPVDRTENTDVVYECNQCDKKYTIKSSLQSHLRHTAHCTLHTAHCTLHIAHCTTIHTAHCTLHNYRQYTVGSTLQSAAHYAASPPAANPAPPPLHPLASLSFKIFSILSEIFFVFLNFYYLLIKQNNTD